MKGLKITSFMVSLMYYLKDRSAHVKTNGSINVTSLGQEYGTIFVSSVRVVYGEVII